MQQESDIELVLDGSETAPLTQNVLKTCERLIRPVFVIMTRNTSRAVRHAQEMDTRHKTIRASRFTLKPMHPIAMDTIGPLDIAKQFKYFNVIIDTFT